ncbi:MAG TPA: MBL fold metallo-hydrolase [Bacillota bacterium]|nr:MBL fold metallo-hydrolase [Bacillota bacterium]
MEITFCGAAGTVTGSCFMIETDRGVRFIVDCGMYQGSKEIRRFNQEPFQFDPEKLDFMILTHAHIDHSGLIPKLCKSGFKKPIYTTKATAELCKISLRDSAHIQEMDTEWRNRKRLRKGEPPEEPLYTVQDAEASLEYFYSYHYQEIFEPAPGVKVRFQDAGHIMGSAIAEIWITEDGDTVKIVFSGDLGQKNQPIIKDPTVISEADYVLMETTYGNRLHEDSGNKAELLKDVILQMVRSGGNLVIPAFTIGRTQDLLYHIKTLLLRKEIPRIPVYIDSPMAVSITEIYREHPGYYDEQMLAMLMAGESPFEFEGLHFVRTVEESKRLNETANRSIIISANGMCESGRILHHLKHNLWRPDSHILFSGYQAEGTLGRRLLEGAKVVKIMGEEINVQATIHSIDGFSAHADQAGLLEWLSGFVKKPRGVFLVHGEPDVAREFAAKIQQQLNIPVQIPKQGESFQLNATAHLAHMHLEFDPTELRKYHAVRTVTDMEHMVLAFKNRLRKADYSDSKRYLEGLRKLLDELETTIEKHG